jgi:hypothetical protein
MLAPYYTGSKTTYVSHPNCFDESADNLGRVTAAKQFSKAADSLSIVILLHYCPKNQFMKLLYLNHSP